MALLHRISRAQGALRDIDEILRAVWAKGPRGKPTVAELNRIAGLVDGARLALAKARVELDPPGDGK